MMTHPLVKHLAETGTSKTDLARKVGASRMAIWRIISGKGYSLDMVRRVSDETGIPVADLIEWKEAAQ